MRKLAKNFETVGLLMFVFSILGLSFKIMVAGIVMMLFSVLIHILERVTRPKNILSEDEREALRQFKKMIDDQD